MKFKYLISLLVLLTILSCSKSKDNSTPNLVNYGSFSLLIGKSYADVTSAIQGTVISKEATLIKTTILVNAETIPVNYEFKNNLLDKITITSKTNDATDLLVKIYSELYGTADYKIYTSDLTLPLSLDQSTFEQNYRIKTYQNHPVNYAEADWQKPTFTISAIYTTSLVIQISAITNTPVS
ncbi:MAG: hypothetical protein HXX14_02185 [Bacteroidetes bacterium]|nr:hypothetical protein [Bacteroidota bacterium]